MSKLIDLTGRKFGRLIVLCRAGTYRRPSGTSEPTWKCVCDCGNEVVVSSSNLGKSTLSCGCLQKENRYGARRENEYEIKGDVITAVAFGGEKFIVNTCDLETVKEHRWHINNDGYITDGHGNTLHRIIMNPPNGMDVHHINGDKLDNRRCNLLMLTRSEHTSLHRNGNIANGVTVREKGEWVDHACSCCGKVNPTLEMNGWGDYVSQNTNYCGNCGADMRPDVPKVQFGTLADTLEGR